MEKRQVHGNSELRNTRHESALTIVEFDDWPIAYVDITGTVKRDQIEVLDKIAYVDGLAGNDTITISSGWAYGGVGNDVLAFAGKRLDDGYNFLDGGAGNDTLILSGDFGPYSSTSLRGGSGNDKLYGGQATGFFVNFFEGGDGNDLLVGTIGDGINYGNNRFTPGMGNDTIVLGADAENWIDFRTYLTPGDKVIGNGLWDELSLSGDGRFVLTGDWVINGARHQISGIDALYYHGGYEDDFIDVSGANGLSYVELTGAWGSDVLIGLADVGTYFTLYDVGIGDVVIGGSAGDILNVGSDIFLHRELIEFSSVPGGASVSGALVFGVEYIEIDLPNYVDATVVALDGLQNTGVTSAVIFQGYSSKNVVVDFSLSEDVNVWWITPWHHEFLDFKGSQLGDYILNNGGIIRVDGGPGDDWIDLNYDEREIENTADTVVIRPGGGNDFVLNFMVDPQNEIDARDMIDVSGFGIQSLAEMLALGQTVLDDDEVSSTVFTFEDETSLTMYDTQLSSYSADNFLFA